MAAAPEAESISFGSTCIQLFMPRLRTLSCPSAVTLLLLGGLGTYLTINFILGNIVEPRVMGRTMGLSTLVAFLSLVVWGWVLGPVGMLLSVPLTMTLKIALDSHPETRWIAKMLSPSERRRRRQRKAQEALDELEEEIE